MSQQIKWQIAMVVEVRQETPTVKTLILDVPDWTSHLAGQRVDVRLTAEDGYQAQRSYSIASPPEDRYVALTIERIEEGEVSTYLTDVLRIGDQIELRGPIGGYFVWNGHDQQNEGKPLFLIAGGSGIVPLMAMLRHRAKLTKKAPALLLYSSRSYDDIIYREELNGLVANDLSLRVLHTLTRQQPQNWNGYRRRIDLAMLSETANRQIENSLVFVCGPTALVETVATYLLELGYKSDQIKTERFGPTGV